VFGSVEKDILKQLHEGKRPALDKAHFHTDYTEKVAPVLLKTCYEFIQTGRDMVTRSKSIKAVPNVTAWLNARATFASTSIVDTLNQALSASLAEGYANNEDMDDLADRVADVFGGQNGIDRNQLIARTETMYACNYGLTEGYKSMGVTKEKWLTADDERTCELCLDMDGEVFDIDDFPTPPQSTHPACRCCGKPYRGDEEAEDWGNDNG
jgi:SPP1 gp7 family putative phage head morphogenesis protein